MFRYVHLAGLFLGLGGTFEVCIYAVVLYEVGRRGGRRYHVLSVWRSVEQRSMCMVCSPRMIQMNGVKKLQQLFWVDL